MAVIIKQRKISKKYAIKYHRRENTEKGKKKKEKSEKKKERIEWVIYTGQ